MSLLIDIPSNYREERDYILSVLLGEFLGLEYRIQHSERRDVRITGSGNGELIIADELFQTPAEDWLTEKAMPRRPLQSWHVPESLGGVRLVAPMVPVIYGSPLADGSYGQIDDERIRLGLDVFGSAFYMLSRYEEIVRPERDKHDRFPATASLAYQEDFLDRPIVNEYLEILWACINKLWPELRRTPRAYRAELSHDVDHPHSVVNKPWSTVLKTAGSDLVRNKDFQNPPRRIYARLRKPGGSFEADPNNTFDFIMATSERHGLRSAFNFITDHSAEVIDGDYSMDLPWVRELMRGMHQRGHEIGLHPSYNTFRDAAQTKRELDRLLEAAEQEGIRQAQWGGRQHFLRWDASVTWQIWADVGLSYDSTLSFADRAGFRCGVCYEYPTFNLSGGRALPLRERPLIVMYGTLFERQYMDLTVPAARSKTQALADVCRLFDGQFTILWHNNELVTSGQRHFYQDIVEAVA